jgi:hypothetical protein
LSWQVFVYTIVAFVFSSMFTHIALDLWMLSYLRRENKGDAESFKNTFCSLPSWKRKTLTYAVENRGSSKVRQVLAPIGIGVLVPLLIVIGIVAMVWLCLDYLYLVWSFRLRSLRSQEYRDAKHKRIVENYRKLESDPKHQQVMELARQLPSSEERDFLSFLRALRKSEHEIVEA